MPVTLRQRSLSQVSALLAVQRELHIPRRTYDSDESGSSVDDVARQPAAVGVRIAELGEHGLRVLRDQLVQDRALGCSATITSERPSGRAGRLFVETAGERACAH